MLRMAAFVIALLLLAGSIDPTRGWLIALVVLTGLAALNLRPGRSTLIRPALDMRLAALIVSTMLLAGAVDATRDWLIVLSVVTGLAAFFPRILRVPGGHDGDLRWR